jgi:hypothetical protein
MTSVKTPSFVVTTETLLTAHSGRETLLLRYDGQSAGSVAIDENDNGVIPTVRCAPDALARLATALKRSLPASGEAHTVEIAEADRGCVTLHSSADGFRLIVAAFGERPRTFFVDAASASLLGTAIRGSFGFWD